MAGPPALRDEGLSAVRPKQAACRQSRAYDLWLDCHSQRAIAEIIGKEFTSFADVTQPTIKSSLDKKSADTGNLSPPASRQHFDVWNFATADKTAGHNGLPSSTASSVGRRWRTLAK